jgi:hypothetical protein
MTTFRTRAESRSGFLPQRDQAPPGDGHVRRRLPAAPALILNCQAARAVATPADGAPPQESCLSVWRRSACTGGGERSAASARLASRSMGSRTRARKDERVATNG